MRRALSIMICGLLASLTLTTQPVSAKGSGPAVGSEPATFPYGVGANDVTATTANLWTQTTASPVLVAWSADPKFIDGVGSKTVGVSTAHDGTVLVHVSGLKPAATYFYRFIDPDTLAASRIGTFTTAPPPGPATDLTFTMSGDQDGTPNPSAPSVTCPGEDGFLSFATAQAERGQFYVNLGDTIYSDSECRAQPAKSLQGYRDAYKQNLSYATLRDFRASTAFYTQWDDHEVRNDFDSQTVDPLLLQHGRRAFMEYDGMTKPSSTLGFYRHFKWGSTAEVFILDERSFRTSEADRLDTNENGVPDCRNPVTGQSDVAPTLSQEWRDVFATQLPGLGLEKTVSRACVRDLNLTGRTMLGKPQRDQFLHDLHASTATWKLVLTEDPIQQFFALSYDRWEGYRWERNLILNFIDTNDINNVVWLATDVHAFLAHSVDYNTDTPGCAEGTDANGNCIGVQGMYEYTFGPVATFSFAREINSFAGSDEASGRVRAFLVFANQNLCAGIDPYGYGLIHIDAGAGSISIYPKDEEGIPVAGNGEPPGGPFHYSDCYDYHATAAP